MYDMIIIGGGPAAMAAAFFAHGKGLNALMVFEDLGGKVGWRQALVGPDREDYLPGNELVQVLARSTANAAARVIHDRVTAVTTTGSDFRITTAAHGVLESAALLVATGATPIELDAPGARQLVDHGLEYSATTYAHLATNQRVAVVGSSMRALNGAAELAHTAAQVYLVASDINPHGRALVQALKHHPRVDVLEGYHVAEVVGVDEVEGLVVHDGHQTRRLAVEHVYVNLDLRPNSAIVRDLAAVDANGFILVDEFYETTVPGLFAAGDVTTRFGEQVLAAIGDGARAGMNIYRRLLARWLLAESGRATDDAPGLVVGPR